VRPGFPVEHPVPVDGREPMVDSGH
jgi:hypothetical protein